LRPSSDRVRVKKSIEIRELRRLGGAATCVLVGLDLRGILHHPCYSGTDLNAIPGGLLSTVVQFGIPVFFCTEPQTACWFVGDFFTGITGRDIM
jgi:hypothetical protein